MSGLAGFDCDVGNADLDEVLSLFVDLLSGSLKLSFDCDLGKFVEAEDVLVPFGRQSSFAGCLGFRLKCFFNLPVPGSLVILAKSISLYRQASVLWLFLPQ